MNEVVAGFFLGFIVALAAVAVTFPITKPICTQPVFYLEPRYVQPIPRMPPSQGTEKVAGKGPSRVLETSLIEGPWESQ